MTIKDAADLLSFTALGRSDNDINDALRRADSVVGTRQAKATGMGSGLVGAAQAASRKAAEATHAAAGASAARVAVAWHVTLRDGWLGWAGGGGYPRPAWLKRGGSRRPRPFASGTDPPAPARRAGRR